jgi:hypothetical protein
VGEDSIESDSNLLLLKEYATTNVPFLSCSDNITTSHEETYHIKVSVQLSFHPRGFSESLSIINTSELAFNLIADWYHIRYCFERM